MRENFFSCSVLVLVERDELIQEDFSFYYFDGWKFHFFWSEELKVWET